MENLDELLAGFARDADKILKEELKRFNIKYSYSGTRMYDVKSVGVQGDGRTYGYPCEIEIVYNNRFVWDQEEFTRRLSNRITNEVEKKYYMERLRSFDSLFRSLESGNYPRWLKRLGRWASKGKEILINKVLYVLREEQNVIREV